VSDSFAIEYFRRTGPDDIEGVGLYKRESVDEVYKPTPYGIPPYKTILCAPILRALRPWLALPGSLGRRFRSKPR
jgi:hypothetical protein